MAITVHGKLKCPKCSTTYDISLQEYRSQHESTEKPEIVADTRAHPSTSDLGELLDSISEEGLSGKAADFVTDMRARYAQYGARTRVSEKQRAWLEKIAQGEEF